MKFNPINDFTFTTKFVERWGEKKAKGDAHEALKHSIKVIRTSPATLVSISRGEQSKSLHNFCIKKLYNSHCEAEVSRKTQTAFGLGKKGESVELFQFTPGIFIVPDQGGKAFVVWRYALISSLLVINLRCRHPRHTQEAKNQTVLHNTANNWLDCDCIWSGRCLNIAHKLLDYIFRVCPLCSPDAFSP